MATSAITHEGIFEHTVTPSKKSIMKHSHRSHKISWTSRIAIAIASLAIIACYFVPIWEIHLWAPQYPEGLSMYIWHNNLSGEVNIINGLNHYIGMKLIKVEMFPEFKILGILIGIFIVWGLIVSVTGSFRMVVSLFIGDIIFAIAALADFFRWGYDYGHNLNPEAAIQVPGMSYQPPLIGYKTLLNFEAYSGPYTGGWIVVGAGVVTFLVLFFEWRKKRKHYRLQPHVFGIIGVMMMISFSSCSQTVEPIQYGKDNCSYCQMTIMKNNCGGEIISKKGKVFKFDDAGCLHDFIADKKITTAEIGKIYFNDFEKGVLVESVNLVLVKNDMYKTPMSSHIISVRKENAKNYLSAVGSTEVELNQWLTQ